MKRGFALAAVAAVCCVQLAQAQTERADKPTITQAEAKRALLANRSRLFKDPGSIRDAKVSQPFTCLTGSGNCICIEANARNSFGGYTGIQLVGFQLLGGGKVEPIGQMYARDKTCGRTLSPFPEFNG